jgi:hypothetical protein
MALLTESQGIWASTQIKCLLLKSYQPAKPTEGSFKRILYNVVAESWWFEPVVTTAIIFNVFAVCLESIPEDPYWIPVLHWINVVCLYIFSVDVLIRTYALGPGPYIRDNWAKLDVVIVLTAWVSVLAQDLPPGFGILRGLRVFRVVMLMRKSKFLQPLFRTIILAVPACFNITILTTLCIFVYAILCMNVYGGLEHFEHEDCITSEDNFDDFWSSMKFLIQIFTGQEFMNLVFCLENMDAMAPLMIIGSYIIISYWLFYNLFVVVLVDMFIRCLVDSKVEVSEQHVVAYQQLWINGHTDPMGEFLGENFTDSPEHETIGIRKIAEFVPQLLPPTEVLDASWAPHTATNLFWKFLTPQETMSPLAKLVPHRFKHGEQPAIPYKIGMEAHVDGRLCEIVSCEWEDAEDEAEASQLPVVVTVQYIESEKLDASRVVSHKRLHVPPVDGFTGYVDGQACEITW